MKFIISVDDINASWLFDETMWDSFNFVTFKIDTFKDFSNELEQLGELFSHKNEVEEISVGFVFKSMVANA